MKTLNPVAGDSATLRNSPAGSDLQPKESAPVILWAIFGVVFIGLIAYAWTRWIIESDFTATPAGPDKMSDGGLIVLRVFEVGSVVVSAVIAWLWLIRPLIRQRKLTLDGMLVIASFTCFYQDAFANYFNFTLSYNANFVNLGSWTPFIPGGSDRPNIELFPHPLIALGSSYIWWICGAAGAGCWVLRKLRERNPRISTMKMLMVLFGLIMVADLITEVVIIRGNIWAYPGTIHSLTLWAGSRYQFPLYEPVIVAIWCSGLAAFRYFRDDRGCSFAEKGVTTLRMSGRRKTMVSLLAVIGFMQVWFAIGYYGPWSAFATKVDTFPAMPSYMRAGMCGDGTDYACPSREFVPVPLRSSLHIGPDDPRLPQWVRDRQGLRPEAGTKK